MSSRVTAEMVSSLCGGRCGSFLITPKPDLFPGPKMMASTSHLGLQNLSGSWKLPALLRSEHVSSWCHGPVTNINHLGPKASSALSDGPTLLSFMHLSSSINGKLNKHRSRAQAS